MPIAPIAFDDNFSGLQGLTTSTITGNLGADNGQGIDFDPNGTVLGWTAIGFNPVGNDNGFLGAFFSNGVLGFLSLGGTVSYPFPVFSTSTFIRTEQGGTVILNTNGSFTYTAPAGFYGVDGFDYTLVDVEFNIDVAHVTLNVVDTPEGNDRPIAVADIFAGVEDTQIIGNLLADNGNGPDFDPNGDALTVNNHTIMTARGGIVSIYANGNFVYTPPAGFSGADSFVYTLKDSNGASSIGNVTLNVSAVNDAPIANNDSFSGSHGKPISGNVLANDTDQDGDTLTAIAAAINTAAGGVVSLLANGQFTYVPAAGFVGRDSFTYTVEDGNGGSSSAIVSLNLTNAGPVANTDWYTALYGKGLSGNVLANDTDADGDALSAAPANITTASGGSVKLNADGTFTYKPGEAFYGTDSFQYTVTDGFGGTAAGTALINTAAPTGSVYGSYGIDTITGTAGNDYIFALADDDTIYGLGGNDMLAGGADKDALWGDAGDDSLYGQAGKDVLQGGIGNDYLSGGLDGDDMYGGDGVDKLVGGAGLDKLFGGNGNDQFVFDIADGTSYDKVMDFKRGDKLCVNASDYGLNAGALPDASYFALAGAANVGHGRFLFDSSARSLSWDADGNAATANVLIATFDTKVTLSTADFLVL